MTQSINQERRNNRAAASRVEAVQALTQTDFTQYMASGFNILITDLAGQELCPEFTVPGEDMTDIAPEIVKSLRESLKIKRAVVVQELNAIDEALDPSSDRRPPKK